LKENKSPKVKNLNVKGYSLRPRTSKELFVIPKNIPGPGAYDSLAKKKLIVKIIKPEIHAGPKKTDRVY
jgi:hypothetical protein